MSDGDPRRRPGSDRPLTASEERFRWAQRAGNVGVWEYDVATGHTLWSEQMWALYGHRPDAEVDCEALFQASLHPEDAARVRAASAACVPGRDDFHCEFRIVRPDGEIRWIESMASFAPGGGPPRVIGVNLDITRRKATEQALRQREERLRAIDRRKDEFLAMLGHELRNPLATIRHAAELVAAAGGDDPRLARAHGAIDRQVAHMTRLIDGLLEISRIGRGKIELDRRPLDLGALVDAVVQDQRARLAADAVALDWRPPAGSVWVSGDAVRLAQVVDNLLSNALKFTDRGAVTVRLAADGDDAVLTVRDTGVGIGGDMLASIFEPFRQDPLGRPRAAGGLGLGLALVRGLVRLHAGRVEAQSDGPGQGARFVVRLPRGAPPLVDPSSAPPAVLGPPRRVLIVEDEPDAAAMLADLLTLRGHAVRHVSDAPAALAALRSAPFDVVLCDIGLPGMDGYALAREVHADPALAGVALVALTGFGQAEDRRRAIAAGFAVHLTKPVEQAALDAALVSLGPPLASLGEAPCARERDG